MVFYFTCEYKDPGGEPYIVYMGADKYENEGLIEWGQTRDVWFHVDGLSSAHVYLRLPLAAAQDAGVRCDAGSSQGGPSGFLAPASLGPPRVRLAGGDEPHAGRVVVRTI